jgi:sugar O-acyltransferase (sialic acid O-acetyltransferase NeuD family)
MTRPLVILGASGNALDVLDVVDAVNAHSQTWEVVGVLDDARPLGTDFHGLTVLGKLAEAGRLRDCRFVNGVGSDRSHRLRPQLVAGTGVPAERFTTLVHPLAAVSPRARLGRGVIVNAGVVLAGNVTVGDHVWLGPGCVIGHDTVIEDHALLAPAAVVSGFCHLGAACYVGAAAILRQRVRVGAGALVGMGAVVLQDVASGATVVGNPARPLERTAGRIEGAR